MKKQWPAWIVLGLIALVAGAALGFTNGLTAPVIAEQALIDADNSRREVMVFADEFVPVAVENGAVDDCYEAKASGQTVGHTVQVTTRGYGGEIEIIVGIDTDGVITGIIVGGASFSETPGLGAKTKEPAFTEQFKGLTPPAVLKGNVDSVTGASISSGAVVGAVNAAVDFVAGLK